MVGDAVQLSFTKIGVMPKNLSYVDFDGGSCKRDMVVLVMVFITIKMLTTDVS